ncbi:hypothetical protein MRX96_020185 [Rhipicephalus microplus]
MLENFVVTSLGASISSGHTWDMKKRFTAHERKMVFVKILQDALSNPDACPNSALMVTPDVESGWFLVSYHVWVKHDHQPLKDAVAAKRFPKPGATYFVHGGTGTL